MRKQEEVNMVKKYNAYFMIIVILMLAFSFTAMLEYRHSVELEQDSIRENLVNVQTNIENMI